ncbi:aromatic acid exporter family protein [Thalassobacillus sp. C254]|uniref:aromatic acid exporter family protein n=1 Tax=Thalassobacillus sp. C254 TaxID=1225341 RepID=UPI0006CFE234|nr:aromatic acid exporter family protein [Thalassobacillus sp. C254]
MFKIGYRTLKTAIGAGLAILIAQTLQLDFYASAGIIAILCITVTRRDSLRSSWERILASLIGLLYATVIFELAGYHFLSITILLLLFIPTVVAVKAKKGVATSAVIMFHLYTLGEVSAGILINEVLLIVIGVGVALLMNWYMPSAENELVWDQVYIEEAFQTIWKEFARYLKEGDTGWTGKEFTEASNTISHGKGKALINIDNHFLREDDYFYHYFKMREKQLEILERILPFISTLDDTVIQGEKIADFMNELSGAVYAGNTANYFLTQLDDLREELQAMDLPETRQEFEIRSSLFYILHELEQYLLLKKMFKADLRRTQTVSVKKRYKVKRRGENKKEE